MRDPEVRIIEADVSPERLRVVLSDGREIHIPLGFYPTLAHAPDADRGLIERYPRSLYWPALDVDIGVEGILAGARELPCYAAKPVAVAEARGV